MHTQSSKALALLGGVATLALGSTFLFRSQAPKPRAVPERCVPRMLELERAVCEPEPRSVPELARLSPRPH